MRVGYVCVCLVGEHTHTRVLNDPMLKPIILGILYVVHLCVEPYNMCVCVCRRHYIDANNDA